MSLFSRPVMDRALKSMLNYIMNMSILDMVVYQINELIKNITDSNNSIKGHTGLEVKFNLA